MRAVIEAVDEQKKIHAIKCLRAATGLGLKDAKYVIDEVAFGREQKVELLYPHSVETLDEGYIRWRPVLPDFVLADFVEWLDRYPVDMTVGNVLSVLRATRDLQGDPAVTPVSEKSAPREED